MKPVKSTLQKVRARNGTDIFYTYSDWPTKDVDGTTFICVSKNNPQDNKTAPIHWMKKDNMEYVK
jgi:hypothetical protein